jgi:hypothetical protein
MRRRRLPSILLGAAMASAAMPAGAMEWTRSVDLLNRAVVYKAEGPIVPDDAERLQALIEKSRGADGRPDVVDRVFSQGTRVQVRLNSDGGSAVGGIRLGYLIRERGFDTVVPTGAGCHSACSMAFIGGVSRTVSGLYGIHAMSPGNDASTIGPDGGRVLMETAQRLSSIFSLYTREMLSNGDMADAALQFGSKGIKLVTDTELRDWNIITVASRPQQAYRAQELSTIDCVRASERPMVKKIVCNDLGFGRSDVGITRALKTLSARIDMKTLGAEQSRWTAHRDDCERLASAPPPRIGANGHVVVDFQTYGQVYGQTAVEGCLETAYRLRLRELEALVGYYTVRDEPVAAKGWHAARP